MVTAEQWIVFGTLALALILFVSGRWRYDVVALAALLIISRAILNTGVVDSTVRLLSRAGNHPALLVAALTCLVALCSGFMNNIGAPKHGKHGGSTGTVLLLP